MNNKQNETKDFSLEIKELGEEGSFSGWLSVYGNLDLGNDIVEKGAFTKSLKENGGVVPLLWQHNPSSPIGQLQLEDKEEGLWVTGTLLKEDLIQAREAYVLMKAGIVKGLSIGFRTIRKKMIEGVRHLKELKLLEGSVVTFPMNTEALIQNVKSAGDVEWSFSEMLSMIEMTSKRHQMLYALQDSLSALLWDTEIEADEKVEMIAGSIDQFKNAYVSFLPKYLEFTGQKSDSCAKFIDNIGQHELHPTERELVSGVIEKLESLIGDAGDTRKADAGEDTSTTSAACADSTSNPKRLRGQVYLKRLVGSIKSEVEARNGRKERNHSP